MDTTCSDLHRPEGDRKRTVSIQQKKKPSHATNHIVSRVGLVPEGWPWDATNSGVQTWIGKILTKFRHNWRQRTNHCTSFFRNMDTVRGLLRDRGNMYPKRNQLTCIHGVSQGNRRKKQNRSVKEWGKYQSVVLDMATRKPFFLFSFFFEPKCGC